MRTSSTGNRGFTLVELIVVLVIISVLTTMIVPRMYRSGGSTQLRQSAHRFLLTVQYALNFAATRRCQCRLMIDTQQQRYTIVRQKDPQHDPNEFIPIDAALAKAEQLGEGMKFSKVWIEPRQGRAEKNEQADCITFEPTGQADAAVVEITDGKRTYSVLVMPHTGHAKLVEGSAAKLPNDRLDLDE